MIANDISNEQQLEDERPQIMIQDVKDKLVRILSLIIFNQASLTYEINKKIEDSEQKIMQEIRLVKEEINIKNEENRMKFLEEMKKLLTK